MPRVGAEVVQPCPVEKFFGQGEGTVLVAADVPAAVDEVARLAGSHVPLLVRVARQEPVEETGIVTETACLHVLPEDAPISLGARRLDGETVAEPAEEGLLGEVGGVQVAGEDQQLLEWDLDLLAGMQRQIIDVIFQRDDPAVEEVVGLGLLMFEIID